MSERFDFRERVSSDLIARLENWARFVSGGSYNKCSEVNALFVILQRLATLAGVVEPVATADRGTFCSEDAARVERCVVSRHLTIVDRRLIVGYWVEGKRPEALCRAVGMRFREFDPSMLRALQRLEEILKRSW